MRWMQITAAIPSTTAFSMQRPVCAEGICGVMFPNRRCRFCWYKYNIHISSKRCTMKIMPVILTILTYTYFFIKNLVTSGRLFDDIKWLSPQQLCGVSSVFLSQVDAINNFWSIVPSRTTNTSVFPTSYRPEQGLVISVSPAARPVTALSFVSYWILLCTGCKATAHKLLEGKFQKSLITGLSPKVKSCNKGRQYLEGFVWGAVCSHLFFSCDIHMLPLIQRSRYWC